jgi:5-methylcytosine-specific restriction endonuclease McrA
MEDTGQLEEPEEVELPIREGIRAKIARAAWRALEVAALVGKAIADTEWPCTRCRRRFPLRDLPAWQFTSNGPYHPVCRECYAILKSEREREVFEVRENQVVQRHLRRAIELRRAATLTLPEWIETLEHYKRSCAYCGTGAYEVLEHYTPLTKGGGTTANNCVPACQSCNSQKRDRHPDVIMARANALKPVGDYLRQKAIPPSPSDFEATN